MIGLLIFIAVVLAIACLMTDPDWEPDASFDDQAGPSGLGGM